MTLQDLRNYGANVEAGLALCGNDEAEYLRLVGQAASDPSFRKLSDALDDGDMTGAFESAYALRAVLEKLSLTPLSEPVREMTELLRDPMENESEAFWKVYVRIAEKLDALEKIAERKEK